MKYSMTAVVSLIFLIVACKEYEVIDKPIIFDEQRRTLTLQYMQDRYGIEQETPSIEPEMIVVHWTQIPTFQGSFDAFNRSALEGAREDIADAGALNVSAHYLIDQDGSIYRLLPDTLMARHVIGLNHIAIGIENVGGTDATPLTEEQFAANAWLIRELTAKYNIQYLIGHYEYPRFENHPLWREKDPGYRTKKVDPGSDFMESLRNEFSDLTFQPVPTP
jgi:N-acetylmuramoyl-L-alanine amidase